MNESLQLTKSAGTFSVTWRTGSEGHSRLMHHLFGHQDNSILMNTLTNDDLTLLLQAADNHSGLRSTVTMQVEDQSSWSDLSFDEWNHLVLAVDEEPDVTDTNDTSSMRLQEETNISVTKRTTSQSQRYRQRKRLEMADLRMQIDQLQTHLQQLTQRRLQTSTTPVKQNAVLWAWKRIAVHQKAARHQAEQENVRLKLALEQELKMAQKLVRLIRKCASRDARWRSHNTSLLHQEIPPQDVIFQQLHHKLSSRVVLIDSLLQQVGYATTKIDLDHTRERSDGLSSVNWEILWAKVLPFTPEATANVIWACCASTPWPPRSQKETFTIKRTDTEIEMLLEIPAHLRLCEVLIQAHIVMRRSRDPSRTFQWYEGAWILRSTNEMYDGIILRDEGWHVIEGYGEDKRSASIVQCYSHLHLDTSTITQSEEINLIRDVVLKTYKQNLRHAFVIFETVLLNEMMS